MIKAQRITTAGTKPFERVDIYTSDEQGKLSNLFEDDQISFKNKDGKFTLPIVSIILIQISSKRKIREDFCIKAKRISISGDLVYSPASIVKPHKYEEAGIPIIFRHKPISGHLPWDKQFTFVCNDGLFITTDYKIELIEW